MDFRITPHAGSKAPEDAIETLWQHLGDGHEDVSFARPDVELIRATIFDDAPIAMTSDEREALGRRRVLEVVREVSESSAELSSDWFAVGPDR